MDVGFTGTRKGLSEKQRKTLISQIETFKENESILGYHGDCIGADAEFHEILVNFGFHIVIYPPFKDDFRAFCDTGTFIIKEPKSYFERNRLIVNDCDLLIACPFMENETDLENYKGGTQYTIEYALTRNKKVIIIYRDGSTSIK